MYVLMTVFSEYLLKAVLFYLRQSKDVWSEESSTDLSQVPWFGQEKDHISLSLLCGCVYARVILFANDFHAVVLAHVAKPLSSN
jgi:hypothetical protein